MKVACTIFKERIVWLVLAFLSAFCVQAQLPDYHLQSYGYSYGIRPGFIHNAIKDKDGFLWILYPRSVQRFDGKQVKNFAVNGTANSVYCDAEGQVWVTTHNGVLRFTDDVRGFRKFPVQSKGEIYPVALFEIPGSELHLLANDHFYRFDTKKQSFVPTLHELRVKPPFNSRLFGVWDETIFFCADSSIYSYSFGSRKSIKMPNRNIRGIFPINKDSALLSAWNNTSYWYNFSTRTISPAQLPAELTTDRQPVLNVRSMACARPHQYLMVAREGIFEYNDLTRTFRMLHFFLEGQPLVTSEFANSIAVDEESNVWLATIYGISRFSLENQTFGRLQIAPGHKEAMASTNTIRRMVEDRKGNLWVATGNGFASWNKKRDKWELYLPVIGATNKLSHPSIRGLAYDGKYLILGPTSTGVWLFDPVNNKYHRPDYSNEGVKRLLSNEFIDDIVPISGGRYLIMGRDAIYVMDKRYRISEVDVPAGKYNSNFALQGTDGCIWVGTNNGLYCLDSSLKQMAEIDHPAKNKTIQCGFVNDKHLLFATDEGVFTAAYVNNTFNVKKLTPAFDKLWLYILYEDAKGMIWACSEEGVYRYDPTTSKLHLFDYSDNVQGYGFNSNAWFRSSDSILFLGGINGINYLRPETYLPPADSPKVYVQHVKINDNDTLFYSLGENPLLSANQQSIEVAFTTPYFNNPDKVKYRYQLQGYDDDWKYLAGNNTLRLTSLPSGSYLFRLQASLNGVDWVEAKNDFAFRIDAPFWKKWWFILLGSLILFGCAYLIIRRRNEKLRINQEELESEKAINYFASSLHELQSVDAILWDVAKNCIGRLQFEDCVIYLVDDDRKTLVQKAAHGPKNPKTFEIEQPIHIPIGKGITGTVAQTGIPEIINDTTKDPRYIVDDKLRHSEIAVPIISDGKVLGVIDSEHSKKNFFSKRHLSILTTIASLCANKIVRARAEVEKQKAQSILMDTQRKMTEVEMQALRAQMNPHFIFNCLNSINRYIVKSDQATASLYLTKFAKLIRLILDNSNSKNVLLSHELEALKLYIDMEALRFDKKFSYSINVAGNVNADSIELPPLIIQPYVENAIWHGLLHKNSIGHLGINVSLQSESMLQCVIEDNGVGREKARELRSKSATTKKSLGMKLTEDRLSLMNKHAELNASIEIIDLYTNEKQPAGTKVLLRIPI